LLFCLILKNDTDNLNRQKTITKRIKLKSKTQTSWDSRSIGWQAYILNLFAALPNPQDNIEQEVPASHKKKQRILI
jgi:hypothetical protein